MLNSAADWCCSVVDLYSGDKTRGGYNWGDNLKAGTTWGSFEEAPQHYWSNVYDCDCNVGAKSGCDSKC